MVGYTLETFLEKAKELHPELDFSLVTEYKGRQVSVPVICHEKDFAGREHGVFMIQPSNLFSGKCCPKCNGKNFTNEDRKLFCSILHDWKYDYTKSDFSRVKEKTTVTCPIHGDFQTSFDNHFNKKCGCKECFAKTYNTEIYVGEANKVHNGKYRYDKTVYENMHGKIIITCPEHGDFEQVAQAHLRGEGCPKCATQYNVLENKIETILKENNIKYEQGKAEKWLITEKKGQSHLDFYIPDCNLAIECQGKQHFGVGGWNNRYDFEERYAIDKWKKEQCDKRGIELIYFANQYSTPKKFINEYLGRIFFDEKELLKYVKYLLLNLSKIDN